MPWIHVADWIALVTWMLQTPAASGPLNASAPEPVSNGEFAATLGRVLRRPHVLRAPAFALRAALGEMADAVLTGQRVVPARAVAHGFHFVFETLEPALRDLVVR
jgi:NAD dependent epimerase/dehydratase family enzyme